MDELADTIIKTLYITIEILIFIISGGKYDCISRELSRSSNIVIKKMFTILLRF